MDRPPVVDWPGWALKGLIAGSIGLLVNVLSEHSRQLREIQVLVAPMQYDLKAISEKGAQQRDAIRSLHIQLQNMRKEENKK